MNNMPKGSRGMEKVMKLLDEIREELDFSLLAPGTRKKIDDIDRILESETKVDLEVFGMAAQVSLYPLRVSSLSPFINDALNIFERLGLDMIPGTMSTVVYGNSATLWRGLEQAFASAAARGEAVMTVTVSNACPIPQASKKAENKRTE